MALDQLNNIGLFVSTTNIWELDQLQGKDIDNKSIRELLVRLYQNINNIAITLNLKESAYYPLNEFINGQLFFTNPLEATSNYNGRQVFRTVVNFGALPNATTKSIPHNISTFTTFSFTRIYGCSTNPLTMNYIPIPYSSASAVANNIELSVDSTNVSITTGIDQTAYTTTYVILEYIKE